VALRRPVAAVRTTPVRPGENSGTSKTVLQARPPVAIFMVRCLRARPAMSQRTGSRSGASGRKQMLPSIPAPYGPGLLGRNNWWAGLAEPGSRS
jgi:hypothetical protein